MKLQTIDFQYTEFSHHARWFQIRGYIMIATGILFLVLCVIKPRVLILQSELSWLPLLAIAIILVGMATLSDAILSKHGNTFLVNAQIGVGDLVVGGLILFSVGKAADHVALLIAAYLMIKGIMRAFTAYATHIPNLMRRIFESAIAVVLGLMAASDWLSSQAWFLSLCLSVDIGMRGWAILKLGRGLSSNTENLPDEPTNDVDVD